MQPYEKHFQILKGILITLLVLVGANYAIAEWNDPAGNPPDLNAPAPINVSASSQTKTGALIVGGLRSLTDVIADERFQLKPNAGAGKVLTSDATGFGTWQTPSGGGGGAPIYARKTFSIVFPRTQTGLRQGSISTDTPYDFCAITDRRHSNDNGDDNREHCRISPQTESNSSTVFTLDAGAYVDNDSDFVCRMTCIKFQ